MSAAGHVDVAAAAGAYRVSIAPGLLARAGTLLAPYAQRGRLIIVTDHRVWALHGACLAHALQAAAITPVPILIHGQEQAKSWSGLRKLIDQLIGLGIERGDHLVAFGGGVIGDLAGFAAAIVNRGCPYLQIPTTLLAQADSSVGGKTAINVAGGKNLVGRFHPPAAVLVDPLVLATLPKRQLRAGWAEIVKHGLIADAGFFAWCEANRDRVLNGEGDAGAEAVRASVAIKAAIVAADPEERSGQRALLNLGHTFGHALEAETGHGDRLMHGEAVAIGIALAFQLSVERGLCSPEDARRVRRHLASTGLAIGLGAAGIRTSGARLLEHMRKDKKRTDGRLPFILARGIGEAFLDDRLDLGEVERFLDRAAAS